MNTLAERLKLIRSGNTQKKFALKLGISQSSYCLYEKGERIPDIEIANRICNLLGVAHEWLLVGAGPMLKADCSAKTADMSAVFTEKKTQHIENTNADVGQTADTSAVLALQHDLMDSFRANASLQRELTDTIRENGDLRVELERREWRIRELEREVEALRKAMKPAAVPGGEWQGVA